MDGSGHKACSLKRPVRRSLKEAAKLGDVAAGFVEERLSPQQARFAAVSRAWEELLPAELQHHCDIAGFSGGELKVKVDSPSYANELRWCSSQLLSELEQRCPQARVKRITFRLL
ncbi:MAG: DciA family protein [Planctomycetota bacterium]|jgi:hypothetical protein